MGNGETKVGEFREQLKAALVERGLRYTQQRETIAEAFCEAAGHVTIEELLLAIKERDSSIGFATVYRTLKLFTELGLAHEREFKSGPCRYEVADGTHHDHLICIRCGRVDEFMNEGIEALQQVISSQHKYELHSHRMELYGLCPACQKKKS